MDTQQITAPSRATAGNPRPATPSGVIHVNTRHTNRYTVIGNHLAQHREMSLVAIGLAVHIQSLPTGAKIGIKFLADRFQDCDGCQRVFRAPGPGYCRNCRETDESCTHVWNIGYLCMKSMSWRSPMSATQIDIDDEALAAAMRLSGAKTKKEMVNIALREYAERRRRTEARLRHLDSAQEWDDDDFWRRHAADKAGPGADRSEKGVA